MGNKRQAVFDLNLKSWHWSQWLATVTYIIFLLSVFTSKYVFIRVINLRITLTIIALIAGATFNYGYVLGMFVEQERDTILQYLAIPILFIPAGLLAFFLLSRVFTLHINWLAYLKITVTYIIFAATIYLCYKKVTFEYATFSEEELVNMNLLEKE